MSEMYKKDSQYWKFCFYGFLKNLRFFDPYLILFFRETGFTFFEIGLLFSTRELATNLLEIPSGVAADVLGRRKSMIFSFLSYIASFILFFLFSDFYIFLGAMVVFALGEAFRTGTHKAMILDYLKINAWTKWKVHYYGNTRSWAQRGSALSSLIAAVLVFYSGSFRIVFAYTIIPYVVGLLLFLSYPKSLDGLNKDEVKDNTDAGKKRIIGPWKNAVVGLLQILSNSQARKSFFTSAFFDGFFRSQKDYIQPMIETLALSAPVLLFFTGQERVAVITGLVYFVLFIGTSQASAFAGKASKMFSSLPKALNRSYLAGTLLILIIGASSYLRLEIVAILAFIVYYLLENVRKPIAIGFLTENIKNDIMATGLSGESQIKTIFMAILAPLIGFLADKINLGGALMIVAVFSLAVFPFVHLSEEKK